MSTLTKQCPPDKNYVLFMTPPSHTILFNQLLIFFKSNMAHDQGFCSPEIMSCSSSQQYRFRIRGHHLLVIQNLRELLINDKAVNFKW